MNPTWLFVAAVYAAAVTLARRGGVVVPTRVAVLFYLLVLGYFFEPMTSRAVNVHVDVIKTLAPWDYVFDDHTTANPGLNDVPLQEVPWAHLVREKWKSLTPPLWNETTGCGAPLLGNAQSQGLSPLRLLALPLNPGHSMTAEAAMKMLIAMTFLFLYCRRRWSEEASAVAAVTFAFSGALFVWLHFPLATATCFLPAVFYFVDLLVERMTWARVTGAAILWAFILFAGHPETAVHLFLAAILYALWLWPGLKTLTRLGAVMVVGALLAAPYLATFAEAVTKSRRFYNVRHVEKFDEMPLPYSDLASAVPMIQPLFYGPFREQWGPGDADALSGFAGVLALASGIAAAWWVIATRSWRSKEAFFVLLGLLVTGVVFEWPGFSDAIHFVIPIGAHARLRIVLVCALAILTAAAIDHARERRAPLLVGLGVVAAVMAWMHFGFEFPEIVIHHRPFALRGAIPGALVILTVALFVITRTKAAFAVMFAAVLADLWVAGRWFNPPTPDALMYPRTPIADKLDELRRAAKEPFRTTGFGAMYYQNTPGIYGFEDMRVHDPMANHRYVEFLAATSKYDPKQYFNMWDDTRTHVVDFLNVRYFYSDPTVDMPDTARWKRIYHGFDGRIYENTTVLPRFYAARNVLLDYGKETFLAKLREMDDKWAHTALLDGLKVENPQMQNDFFSPRAPDAPIASVSIVEWSPTEYRLRTNAPRYSLIVSSIPWWPGWKVSRNGKRAEPIRVNGAFLGFAVPPGATDVRVWYAPESWRYGVLVSLATLIVLGVRRPRRRSGSRAAARLPHS